MKSRIGYFLIAKLWVHLVSVADIKISITAEHREVRSAIDKRGPGLVERSSIYNATARLMISA